MRLGKRSEESLGFSARIACREPMAPRELLGAELEVEPDLLVHLGVEDRGPAPEQCEAEQPPYARPDQRRTPRHDWRVMTTVAHVVPGFVVRIAVTVPA